MGQQLTNALGFGIGALSTIQGIRTGQFQNQAIARANALSDPGVRAGLVNSPFTAGTLFVGGGPRALPGTSRTTDLGVPYAPGAQQVTVPRDTKGDFAWTPQLSPLDPVTGYKQAQAEAGLDVVRNDQDLARAQMGLAGPEESARILARVPKDENGMPVISNMAFSPGGLTQYQQMLPWDIQARNIDQGNLPGQYGNRGRPSMALTGDPMLDEYNRFLAEASDFQRRVHGGGGRGPGGMGARGGGGGAAVASEPAPAAAATAPPKVSPEIVAQFNATPPMTAGTAEEQANRALMSPGPGWQPMEALPMTPGQAQPSAPPDTFVNLPSPDELGYPSPAFTGQQGSASQAFIEPGGTAVPAAPPTPPTTVPPVKPNYPAIRREPEGFFDASEGAAPTAFSKSTTVPHGLKGSETTTFRAEFPNRQADIDKARLAGLSEGKATSLNAMLTTADAYRNMLANYMPVDPTTGKRDVSIVRQFLGKYKAKFEEFKGNIPFTGSLHNAPFIGKTAGLFDQSLDYQQFKTLMKTLSLNVSTYAGKAITEPEMKLFKDFLVGDVELSEPEFWERFAAIGRVIGRYGRTYSALYQPKVPPTIFQELRSLEQEFPPERWGIHAPRKPQPAE